jgi:pumilio RNA-binding family
MSERRFIGNILADSDSEGDYQSRFSTTDALGLYNRDDYAALLEIRSGSAPPTELSLFSKPFIRPKALSPAKPEETKTDKPDFSTCDPALLAMRGSIAKQALEQSGSRFLQHTLASGSEADRLLILEELMPCVSAITTDIFGNYVVQACLDHACPTHEAPLVQPSTVSSASKSLHSQSLVASLFGSVLELSLHTYGCRVIQKALEKATPDQRRTLVSELKGQVDRCLGDQNANHVIQKSIEVMAYEDIRFIIEAMRPRLLQWATHCYGCRVIQRVIEHCPREALEDEFATLLRAALELSQDAYGNYVVQHMFAHGSWADRRVLFGVFAGNYRRLSKHKFSSNVVEKSLHVAEAETLVRIAEEVFREEYLFELMTDRYANFVVQKVLEASIGPSRNLLISKVQAHSKALRSYPFGRHVLSAVNKLRKRAS